MSSRNRSRGSRRLPGPGRPALAVYPLPAVVGGGRGDVEEIRAAALGLARAGFPVRLLRGRGTPWPSSVAEAWDWPGSSVDRVRRIADRAMTLVPQFGVTAAAARPGRYGRAGAWAPQVAKLESVYGPACVLHVSLEEFARNLPAARMEADRWREGGRSSREIAGLRRGAAWTASVRRMRRLVRLHRCFDRPNLLVLYPTFRRSRSFRRDFPKAAEIGPIWPSKEPRRRSPSIGNGGGDRRAARWIWYASPSSSPVLVPGIAAGAEAAGRRLEIDLRAGRTIGSESPWLRFRTVGPSSPSSWEGRFTAADLRIATGSRTLLEAIRAGGPFLYFNGALGSGSRRRRHRPEKLDAWLSALPRDGPCGALRRDLLDFARARRITAIVRRALTDPAWSARFDPPITGAEPSEEADGGRALVRIAQDWAASDAPAPLFVRRTIRALRQFPPR